MRPSCTAAPLAVLKPLRQAGWISVLAAVAALQWGAAWAQEADTALFRNQASRYTVLDQIEDPRERTALQALIGDLEPRKRQELAEAFLRTFPASARLATVLDIAAKAAIDAGELDAGIGYAKASLRMLPENPLLLAALADAQATRERLDEALASANRALYYLDRFEKPARFSPSEWRVREPELRASCHLIRGRAALAGSFRNSGSERDAELRTAITELRRSRAFSPSHSTAAYLLGVAYALSGEGEAAKGNLADAYRVGGPMKVRAATQLRRIARMEGVSEGASFERYVAATAPFPIPPPPAAESRPPASRANYAGSLACRECHQSVYDSWKRTGMARMFQPYEPANVLGDFASGPEFKTEDGATVLRLGSRQGQHYFEARDASGAWRRFEVDYTIGSKWQQAYATELPDGRIQVLPVQFNLLTQRWLNFWRVIDPPGTERARLGAFHRLGRATNYQVHCASCHTSQLQTSDSSRPTAFKPREHGVNCEMCHGPSGDHVAAARGAGEGSLASGWLPVRFGETSAEAYLDICGRCHMQSNLFDIGPRGEVNYTGSAEAFYAPYKGRPIQEFSQKAFHRDGRFRETTFIGESFARSACFQQGGATCGHCHDPHPADPAENPKSLKFLEAPDRMCLQCHAGGAESGRHTRHAAESEASRCVSCHMPKIMHALMFDAATHRIDDVPDAEATARFGQEGSPNACLLCHTDRDASWLERNLLDWPGWAG